ncbi:MAG: 23S rRNA (uracil(1939)-C(5))-methyltransferase RlmD [Gammaproteobacteria bacterium]|nr:23S rRNA (uracil(1939)-C(5))-methyltransferase RlmD [Gammaproteobacteria bacterium]
MPKRRHRKPQPSIIPVEAIIEKLTPEGRGVAHINGKVTFIDFALPGERVMMQYTRTSNNYDEGRAIEVLQAAADRVQPLCEHFGLCGGCSLQHMNTDAQVNAKQQIMIEQLQHATGVAPTEILSPLRGPVWGYRHKARLGVKFVFKKNKVLVGFREKAEALLADLSHCKVLHPSVGERLEDLGNLIMGMAARSRIPQIEVAVSDQVTALVFRNLEPLNEEDQHKLIEFAQANKLHIYLQPAGPDSVHPLWPAQPEVLQYKLANHNITIEFTPADFTQVNPDINQQMIDRALSLLDLQANEKVLDLFCGLGNFTLPMARKSSHVTGVEGSVEMVVKARSNARLNQIENVEFHAADLSADLTGYPWLNHQYDKILLDPPRSGAMSMLKYLGKLGAKRIVYVSCNPATLARDAEVLVNEYGYKLAAAGVMDMFPHTAHVESIAVFNKKNK